MTAIREMTACTSEHRRSPRALATLLPLLLICAACGGADPPVAAGLPGEPNAVVQRVVDGDTLVVETGGIEERVRLIGIDTPESVKAGTEVECYGKEASANTEELLPAGTEVVLERDVEVRDRYDRLLAYVYRATDGMFVNLALVDQGYAQAAPYPPNVTYTDEFAAATRDARKDGRGLWGACGGDDLYG